MKFSYVLLASLFITSCNDEIKIDNIDNEIKTEIERDKSNIEEVSDCFNNLRPECMVGKWQITSMKLNEQGMSSNNLNLTEAQQNQYIEFVGDKVSGRMFLVKEDKISLTDDSIPFSNIDYSLFEDQGKKKIRFQINQIKIESTIKNINNNVLTLVRGGKTQSKDYIIETVWTKK